MFRAILSLTIVTIVPPVAALLVQQTALWFGASLHRGQWLGVAAFAIALTACLTTLARQAGEKVEWR